MFIMRVSANSKLNKLRTLKRLGFDKNKLTVVLKSYLRPVMEYAAVIWHSSLNDKQAHE